MVTVEVADTGHTDGICRVGTVSWRDAYSDVLPADYVEANVGARYDADRITGEIDGGDGADGIGRWLVALDPEPDESEAGGSTADSAGASESVVGTVRDDRPEPSVGEVSGLYVHPDWQGVGVGSRLLSAVTERQHEDGVVEQHTYAFADNDAAIGFYQSKGFEPGERFTAATVDGVEPGCEAVRLVRSI